MVLSAACTTNPDPNPETVQSSQILVNDCPDPCQVLFRNPCPKFRMSDLDFRIGGVKWWDEGRWAEGSPL